MSRRLRSRIASLGLGVLLSFASAGCFNPFDPRAIRGVGISEPPPAADSPGNVLRLLQWCYKHRAYPEYREIFTADYRFVFSQRDPFGNAYRDNPWTREDELASTENLFQGGDANQPVATSISIQFDNNFVVSDDPRFPGQKRWRKQIQTSVTLVIVDANQSQTNVNGNAVFAMVRGDSAAIPEDLSLGPDSTRWYIARHEDLTLQIAPGGSVPARRAGGTAQDVARSVSGASVRTWGALKVWYR